MYRILLVPQDSAWNDGRFRKLLNMVHSDFIPDRTIIVREELFQSTVFKNKKGFLISQEKMKDRQLDLYCTLELMSMITQCKLEAKAVILDTSNWNYNKFPMKYHLEILVRLY